MTPKQALGAIVVRGAMPSDTPALLALAAASASTHGRHLAEQLALTPGDDHFLLVAETETGAPPLGYLSGGASRDQDNKGGAELYELVVVPGERADAAGAALITEALSRLALAAYGDVTAWEKALVGVGVEVFAPFGFVAEQPLARIPRYRRARTALS